METMNTLNTTDEWERIVNANALQKASARERVAARKRSKRLRKMLNTVTGLDIACIVSLFIGATGVVADWLAVFVAVVCLVASGFVFGRYAEAKKS